RPIACDVVVDVRLLAPQVRRNLRRLGAEVEVEGVRKAVRDVRRQHDRPVAALRAQERGCRGDARLADTALARVQDDPGHVRSMMSRCRRIRTGPTGPAASCWTRGTAAAWSGWAVASSTDRRPRPWIARWRPTHGTARTSGSTLTPAGPARRRPGRST